ncbi:FAD-binding protein [Candidatus Nitronereus thalassa]|uniref:succinate dehydrogenase n=1 Tax=Candidatus Nitronereus thalassa TaxID=3020898 RepID=A0ABU3K8D2_9BACT|nr:FAD-binding protein [Candidatus Nitronereus thalassa]MDT7042700.1 FAD-binding protein [Candidatus Nitronereus thalassa]
MTTTYTYDVLVLGAGLAGMRAALAAHEAGAKVAILTKVHPVRSHSNAAQGGINAALTDRGDQWEDHAFETVKGSDYLGDQDAIEILAEEAGQDILTLEHMGVIFNRNDEGRLGTRRFGGQKRARTFFVSDFTGQAMLHVLYEQIMKANLPVFEEWFATSVVRDDDGRCAGVVAFEIRSGTFAFIKAKAVIIAAGGLGRVFEPSTNAMICTGDGMAIAYRAGAPLMDMEMVQYHPTTLKGKGLLITEAARGEGAYLVNKDGERFMERYAPNMMELASRDVVSRAEQIEINEGRGINGCVLLDCRHLGKRLIQERLGQIYAEAKTFANIDLTEEPIPIRPGMHYSMGGIKTDVDGRCWDRKGVWVGVPGLFAAGETACLSLHGGNRLGANSLLDTVVFGRRTGTCAATYSQSVNESHVSASIADSDQQMVKEFLQRRAGADTIAAIREDLGTTMNSYLGVFRNQDGMENAQCKLPLFRNRWNQVGIQDKGRVFNTSLVRALELGMMLDCAETIVRGAITRTESRGAHFRADYIQRDDEHWLKHILIYHSPEGQPHIDYLPVHLTRWEPQVRVY